jgi:hypothetical protein
MVLCHLHVCDAFMAIKSCRSGKEQSQFVAHPKREIGQLGMPHPFFAPPLLLARQVGVEDAVGLDAVRVAG